MLKNFKKTRTAMSYELYKIKCLTKVKFDDGIAMLTSLRATKIFVKKYNNKKYSINYNGLNF